MLCDTLCDHSHVPPYCLKNKIKNKIKIKIKIKRKEKCLSLSIL